MCRSSGRGTSCTTPGARSSVDGRGRRRAVDHVDRAHELFAIGDRRDDLVGRGRTDRGDGLVVGGLRERDEQLVVLEVDGQAPSTPRELRGQQRGRVLVDRRLQEVDERNAELVGERGREVLGADETEPEQDRGQGLT